MPVLSEMMRHKLPSMRIHNRRHRMFESDSSQNYHSHEMPKVTSITDHPRYFEPTKEYGKIIHFSDYRQRQEIDIYNDAKILSLPERSLPRTTQPHPFYSSKPDLLGIAD